MSRVLNGRTDVEIDLTRRVHAAVQRLGYRPNGLVRSLRMRVTTVIEIIIADVANPFFTSMVRGVEDAAQAAGYSVVFANVDEDLAKEARYIEVAAAEQMAGVILCPASGSDTRIHRESFESFTCHHVLKGALGLRKRRSGALSCCPAVTGSNRGKQPGPPRLPDVAWINQPDQQLQPAQ